MAPVRGCIVAAWARIFAAKKRHTFQNMEALERGTQFDGEKDRDEL